MASQKGNPIKYGEREPWKKTKQRIGRTKPSRAPDTAAAKRKKNDGRPPDTIKDLLLRKPTKKETNEAKKVQDMLGVPQGNQSYPWQNNSCWLDTALELLHTTVSYNFDAFTKACNSVPQDSPFRVLYNMLLARQTQKSPTKATLSKQRNNCVLH
jgi:hypothetical protein